MLSNPHGSFTVAFLALPRFATAGDDESRRNRPGRRHGVGECVKTGLGWWLHGRANIAPRDRIDTVLDDAPALQRLDVALIEREETRFIEGTRRPQFARAKRMNWPAQSGEILLDSAEAFHHRHKFCETRAYDLIARLGGDTRRILKDPAHEAVAALSGFQHGTHELCSDDAFRVHGQNLLPVW